MAFSKLITLLFGVKVLWGSGNFGGGLKDSFCDEGEVATAEAAIGETVEQAESAMEGFKEPAGTAVEVLNVVVEATILVKSGAGAALSGLVSLAEAAFEGDMEAGLVGAEAAADDVDLDLETGLDGAEAAADVEMDMETEFGGAEAAVEVKF